MAATPQKVFDLVTDLDRLPEWNAAIEAVLDRPPELTEGVEWTVKMHPPRFPSWKSVSRVEALDRDNRRFVYERNADGNPSYATWAWEVVGASDGADVTVTWDCYLETLDRRLLAGPLRKRQLAREVVKSLVAMANAVTATESRAGRTAPPGLRSGGRRFRSCRRGRREMRRGPARWHRPARARLRTHHPGRVGRDRPRRCRSPSPRRRSRAGPSTR